MKGFSSVASRDEGKSVKFANGELSLVRPSGPLFNRVGGVFRKDHEQSCCCVPRAGEEQNCDTFGHETTFDLQLPKGKDLRYDYFGQYLLYGLPNTSKSKSNRTSKSKSKSNKRYEATLDEDKTRTGGV
jgi:hypothetical protein